MATVNILEGNYYKCPDAATVYLIRDGKRYKVANIATLTALGNPAIIDLANCVELNKFTDAVTIDVNNAKDYIPVTTFAIGNYYKCLGDVYYIVSAGVKRVVVDPVELTNNKASAIWANCGELAKLTIETPSADNTMYFASGGVALCICCLIFLFLIYFLMA